MTAARDRIETLRRETPSFAPWLDKLAIAIEAAADPAWRVDVPALAGHTLAVDRRAAERLAQQLFGRPASRLDARAALRAALRQERPALDTLAAAVDIPPATFASLADLLALPLLLAAGRRLAAACDVWSHGHCPICAAWPALAELRGLDRARRLRCGRCGADWAFELLRCPFCDNRDHERQRQLVPQAGGEARHVDACDACRGYVKTLPRLGAIPPELVVVEDAATVPLDLVALERDYRRPAPRLLEVEVA